jgi:ABC-2 type transport system ATP-binding protein
MSRADLCAQLGLAELLRRRVGGLSGGQRRRVAIALALVEAPALLLLDEATTNLDESSRAATWALLQAHAARGGAALVTSHILADIESHADRIVALDRGHVVMTGTRDEVRRRLGDSTVSARIPPALRATVLARIDALELAGPAVVVGDELTWRSAQPARVVAEIAALAPDAAELRVSPAPLSSLLADSAAAP